MQKRTYIFFLFAIIFIAGCSELNDTPAEPKMQITNKMTKPGKLVVLMDNNIASYYILQGQARGYDYEMLRWFCKENNLELEIKVVKNFDFMLDSLVAGDADIAAGNLTVTGERRRMVKFSEPLLKTRQVLIQRIPDDYKKMSSKDKKSALVRDMLELDKKMVYVNQTSAFHERLLNISQENGIQIDVVAVAPELGSIHLIEMVSDGSIPFTVADENIARLQQSYLGNIDISTPISLPQSIAWAMRPQNDSLHSFMNEWLDKVKGSSKYNTIYRKYFGSKAIADRKLYQEQIRPGKLTAYDDLIKDYSLKLDWDWRMLAALIQRESKFNPQAQSSFGATGLMQVMPVTAERFGVTQEHLTNPHDNLKAGTGFLKYLQKFWAKKVPDEKERMKFILASYNCGMGHVLDAQRLAEKYKLNPFVWDDNVEVMLKNKSLPKYYNDPVVKSGFCRGSEPVKYVDEILRYYDLYVQFTDSQSEVQSLASR